MIVGYARTCTLDQYAGLDAHIRDSQAIRAERIYKEQIYSVAPRRELEAALSFCRAGDTITKLDRLARSITHFWKIIRQLEEKGVALKIFNLGLDTSTLTGKLMLTVMGGVAEFERSICSKGSGKEYRRRGPNGVTKGESPWRGPREPRSLPSRRMECPSRPSLMNLGSGRHRSMGF